MSAPSIQPSNERRIPVMACNATRINKQTKMPLEMEFVLAHAQAGEILVVATCSNKRSEPGIWSGVSNDPVVPLMRKTVLSHA